MRKIFVLIKREFYAKVFTLTFLISTLVGPIFLIGISLGPAFFISFTKRKKINMYIVDRSEYFNYKKLNSIFNNEKDKNHSKFFIKEIPYKNYIENKKKFNQLIKRGKINIFLIIPKDIIYNGELIYMSRSINKDLIQLIHKNINNEIIKIRLIKSHIKPEIIKRLTKKIKIKIIKITKEGEKITNSKQEFIISFLFLVILYMTIFYYGAVILQSLLQEKTNRIIEILLSSCNPFQLMLGKLFGVGSVGLFQYIIWLVMSYIIFLFSSQYIPNNYTITFSIFFYFLLFFILGYFQFSSLFTIVGAISTNENDVEIFSKPVTFLIMFAFVVSFIAIGSPDSFLTKVLSFIPFFTPMIMFLRIILSTPNINEIILSLFINIIVIFFFIWIASRIYRIGILEYNKSPNLRKLIGCIKYSK